MLIKVVLERCLTHSVFHPKLDLKCKTFRISKNSMFTIAKSLSLSRI